ncbi:MAG TPA: haloacid dehalogenase type II [Gaiellaceae bacterium]|nr:haloacid dehalogenase type II [Gaiellaceae bacterium]
MAAGDRFATFDCYGTLVDWNAGIRGQLARLWPEADADALLERYHEIEPRVQLEGSLPYREVLRQSLVLLAESEGLELPAGEETALADSLPGWPVFPDVPAVLVELGERGWRLVVLSNSDPDLIAASLEAIGVPFDGAVVASEIGSYKPAHGHWLMFFERFGADRDRHVHVAASLYHDIAPAQELGVTAVWVNRLGETSDLPRAAELTDLSRLPETLDAFV